MIEALKIAAATAHIVIRTGTARSALFAVVLLCTLVCQSAQSAPGAEFEIVEWLGRDWVNERLKFPIDAAQTSAAKDAAMVTGDGTVVPFEIVDTPKGSAVEFIANLPAGAKTTYRLKPTLAPAGSDLLVEEKANAIRVTNDHGGIALRTKLADDEGPILAFRTLGGTWSGGSRVLPHAVAGPVVDYEAKIERRGPVAVVVFCRAVFASGLVWKLRVTMQAGDPSIVLDEQWSAWEHPTIEIEPGDASHLDQLYFRKGSG